MKNVAIITSTRAEFGLLIPFIKELRKNETDDFRVSLIVTGTHLSEKHGMTISEINQANVRIDAEIPIRLEANSANDIALNQADVVVKFTDLFSKKEYDAVIILGDRYEMQMIAIAATNTLTPIIHLCGGDTTEGAVDESIRHSITKMSYYHFVTNDISKKRVIQLGEDPERVFNVGSTSIDNIKNMDLLSREAALKSIGLNVHCRYAICTYHPVTFEEQDIESEMMDFISSIKKHSDIEFVVTKANADKGGCQINDILDRESSKIKNLHVFSSLGVKRYLSLVRNAEFVMGNSSSGIVEAPALHVPTINIGDRQKGRLQSESIINCGTRTIEIDDAITAAMSDEMKTLAKKAKCPYGDGNAALRMTELVIDLMKKDIDLKKRFYNIDSNSKWGQDVEIPFS